MYLWLCVLRHVYISYSHDLDPYQAKFCPCLSQLLSAHRCPTPRAITCLQTHPLRRIISVNVGATTCPCPVLPIRWHAGHNDQAEVHSIAVAHAIAFLWFLFFFFVVVSLVFFTVTPPPAASLLCCRWQRTVCGSSWPNSVLFPPAGLTTARRCCRPPKPSSPMQTMGDGPPDCPELCLPA